MILKEAFRMQNILQGWINQAENFLMDRNNVMKTTQEHLRSKANANAENETIQSVKSIDMDANVVLDLLMDLTEEKQKLSNAISAAKRASAFDIDMSLAMNKVKQEVMDVLKVMDGFKTQEFETQGRDFTFNQAGDQTAYTYKIKNVTEIDFDRKKVKGIMKRLQAETDETSNAVDLANVQLQVSYEPKYSVGDTFEDVYEAFKGNA